LVELSFTVDYDYTTTRWFAIVVNIGCLILDMCKVTIGLGSLIGPNFSLFTARHPLRAKITDGRCWPNYSMPIRIQEECWLPKNVIVLLAV